MKINIIRVFLVSCVLMFAMRSPLLAEVTYKYDISLYDMIKDNSTTLQGKVVITNSGDNTIDKIHLPANTKIETDADISWVDNNTITTLLKKGENVSINFTHKLSDTDYLKDSFFSISSIAPITISSGIKEYIFDITVPIDYVPVMSSDSYSKVRGSGVDIFTFNFRGYLEDIDIIGSSDYSVSFTEDGVIPLSTYFFTYQDNESLEYLELMDKYIREYMSLFGALFPYSQFSAISVKMPTGYAMPAYTAIYDKIITQDFIKTLSLPHEILHQWFGVSIRVKGESNWAEAASTYFGDQYQSSLRGEGASYRKKTLIDYMRFLDKGEVYKLSDFRGNDGKASQSVGYGKGMFLFHMIKEALGEGRFDSGISSFINANMNNEASWQDIFESFNDKDRVMDIAKFMLDNTSMIEFKDIKSKLTVKDGEYYLNIKFIRINGPTKVGIKYFIDYYDNNSIEKIYDSSLGENNLSIKLTSPIAKVHIDSGYDLFRKLTINEVPRSFGLFKSLGDVIAIDDKNSCADVIKDSNIKVVKSSADITFESLSKGNYLICGNNPVLRLLLPSNYLTEDSNLSSYAVVDNPLSEGSYIMLVTNPKAENLRLLSRYGALDKVLFDGAKVLDKSESKREDGILVYSYNRSEAYRAEEPKTLADMLDNISSYPIIFIGESHTNFAHHLNQLEVITTLYDSGKKIAVAFEMINSQFQSVLDNYTAGKIDEKSFLKGIEYYDRWKYDHTLYSPIFKFLQEHKISGVALNIENEITRKVGRGGIESLSKEERAKLPAEMNLDNKEYYNDLLSIFSSHGEAGMGKSDKRAFSNFYLAQNIWDEAMAEALYKYHLINPDTIIIVLAGSMHLNKNSGIPLRFKRLSGIDGLVIQQDTSLDINKADIVLSTDEAKLPEIRKLGVSLGNDKLKDKIILKVVGIDNESVAYIGGMREGDILIDCDKKKVEDITDIKVMLANLGDRKGISCTVDRMGNKINIDIIFSK